MAEKTIDYLLLQSLQLQHAGKLIEARAALRKILKQSPLHAEALYLTGMSYLRAHEHEKGADYLRRVVSLLPDHAEAHYNLGVALGKLKRNEEALECHRKAVECKPDYWKARVRIGELLNLLGRHEEALKQCLQTIAINPKADSYFGMGAALAALGRQEEAVQAYRQAIRLNPWHGDAHNNLGYTLGALKRFDEAILAFYSAIAAQPDHMNAHIGLARVFANLNRFDEAVTAYQKAYTVRADADCAYELGRFLQDMKHYQAAVEWYGRALETRPKHLNALNGLGLVLGELKRHQESIEMFQRMHALVPREVSALVNLANAYYECRRFDDAQETYRKVLALQADNVVAHSGLGSVLIELGRMDQAMSYFDRALAIDPSYFGAIYNRGVAYERLFRFDEAIREYERCEAIQPDFAEAKWNRSLVFLMHGRYEEGWSGFESRSRLRNASPVPDASCPRWTGKQKLTSKNLLIRTEEGYGDNIQMARYISLLEKRGAKCWIQCRSPLSGLFARSFPNASVVAHDVVPQDMDLHIPIMSLPGAMKTFTEADIPAGVPYLVANSARLAHWKELTNQAVGLVWRGNPNHANDHNRSSRLVDFLPLFDRHSHVRFVTLQKELTPEERGLLEARSNVLILDQELVDFDESAAVIGNLRILITIDSAPAHLAGALGIPVWILLPFHGEWRWLRDRDDSPWYPTARLFRQAAFGDWPDVIQRIDIQLKQLGETSNA